jgi:small subunit ribosomal protein S20
MAKAKKSTRHASALKAHRQSLRHQILNRAAKKRVRLAMRAVTDAASAKDATKLTELMAAASAALDKAAKSGTLHWKTAARKKSRLAKRAAQMTAAGAKA